MESTTRTKPKILFTGAPVGKDFDALKDVGEVSVKNGKDGLELAEVLWVDCATTKPEQYGPLLRTALDAGKMLVLGHPDAAAHQALSDLVGSQLDEGAAAVMVTRDLKATTPSSYALTVLDGTPLVDGNEETHSGDDTDSRSAAASPPSAPQRRSPRASLDGDGVAGHDWAATLDAHRARTNRSVGGPGLIPPQGVMYGIRTLAGSFSARLTGADWSAMRGKSQSVEYGFNSSFYVYRENGKASPDYVVIRVQQATFSPGALMVSENNAKGYWQFELRPECTNNRGAALLGTSPDTTNAGSMITQISIPLHVKYLQDGSCLANYWSAAHGPVGRTNEGWGVSNQSTSGSGKAAWYHFHRDPWNAVNDPPNDFGRWWSNMYDGGYGGRVKNLNTLAGSSFTVENVSAWRFSASMISSNPSVTFTESLSHRLAAFANPSGTGNGHHQISWYNLGPGTKSITLNLPSVTEDVSSPCR
ncbi:hypothetical protein [Myxococcus qinghaiensis]|uniref:hypothetical protein n=1 Tax=Myxococcus qinghaiensis TaxID=2906758 RepID=UPI0020A82E3D|nr:hypothetical protein [Myxococcus qinghaiensis]MCP3169696.1 hypothetical protein [Myxococcus qinghaiensis]